MYLKVFTMETETIDTSFISECRCDPLKLILNWFFHTFLQKYNLSPTELSKLHYFYKTTVFRYLGHFGPNLNCILTQEIILLLIEFVSSITRETKEERFDLKKEVKELQLKLFDGANSAMPYIKSITYEDPLGNIRLSLNLGEMKGPIIKNVLDRYCNTAVVDNDCHKTKYQVHIVMNCNKAPDDEHIISWMDYRKFIVAQGISKVLITTGHHIDERHYATLPNEKIDSNKYTGNDFLIVGKNLTNFGKLKKNINDNTLSEPDVVLRTQIAEITSDSSNVHKLLIERVNYISESTRKDASLSSCLTSVQNLAKATLHFDIFQKPLDTSIHLVQLESRKESHHALVIMYNYARILSILKKFNEHVETNDYPKLPELSSIDFSCICEKEEEIQLLQLLLEWPLILETTINFIRYDCNLHIIPKFLLTLARTFNNFYFEINVLVPSNSPHNFPAMMARVYLVKALRNIFQTCLDILQLAHTG